MIIVEGMDNTGKSTLVDYLSQRFRLKVFRDMSGPPQSKVTVHKSSEEAKQEFLMETLSILTLNPVAIFDRFHIISEGVYGPILRKENIFDDLGWTLWIEGLIRCNPVIIYCRPPEEKILCFGGRDQMSGVVKNASLLIARYDEVMEIIKTNGGLVVRYDYTRLAATYPIESVVEAHLRR